MEVVVVVVVVVCMFVLGRERQTGILQAAAEQILNDWMMISQKPQQKQRQ